MVWKIFNFLNEVLRLQKQVIFRHISINEIHIVTHDWLFIYHHRLDFFMPPNNYSFQSLETNKQTYVLYLTVFLLDLRNHISQE